MNGDVSGTRAMIAGALGTWADRGWLRKLDAALAGFVAETCPAADGATLLATALTAHLEGEGHACLVLAALLDDPQGLLGWPVDAIDALRFVMTRLPGDAAGWTSALRGSGAVFDADGRADGDRGGQPLVLGRGRLYLRRYWRYERRIADEASARSARRFVVDEARARSAIDRLFAAPTQSPTPDWQKVAAAIALRGGLTIVSGGPGTGKTYTAARLLALSFATAADPMELRVALAAPTGKAAARLRQSIDAAFADLRARVGDDFPIAAWASRIGPARTLHALLGVRRGSRHFRHDAANPLAIDLLIVDEASMVHVEMMDALFAALPADARLILLGDKDQLASVEAGAVLGELCRGAEKSRYTPQTAAYVRTVAAQDIPADARDDAGPPSAQQTVVLRRSERFGGAIEALAQAVNAGLVGEASDALAGDGDGRLAWSVASTPAGVVELAAAGFADYLAVLGRRPDSLFAEDHDAWVREVLEAFDGFRVLCAVRLGDWGVVELNRSIERRFVDDGRLRTGGAWYAGRPVMILRNDHDVGIFNGDIGVALPASPRDPRLRVHFDDGSTTRSVGVARLADVETAFAMTVHKAQGSEFARVALVLPPAASRVATRELLYTGITRARSGLTLVSSRREALGEAIARTTRRSSGIAAMIADP